MKGLLSTLKNGIIYVVTLPLILLLLCGYIVIAFVAMFVVSGIAIYKRSKGLNIFKALPEDIEAENRLKEMRKPLDQPLTVAPSQPQGPTVINVYQNYPKDYFENPNNPTINTVEKNNEVTPSIDAIINDVPTEQIGFEGPKEEEPLEIAEQNVETPIIETPIEEPDNSYKNDKVEIKDIKEETFTFEEPTEIPVPEESIPVIKSNDDEEFYIEEQEIETKNVSSGVDVFFEEDKK